MREQQQVRQPTQPAVPHRGIGVTLGGIVVEEDHLAGQHHRARGPGDDRHVLGQADVEETQGGQQGGDIAPGEDDDPTRGEVGSHLTAVPGDDRALRGRGLLLPALMQLGELGEVPAVDRAHRAHRLLQRGRGSPGGVPMAGDPVLDGVCRGEGMPQTQLIERDEGVALLPEGIGGRRDVGVLGEDIGHPGVQAQVEGPAVEDGVELAVLALALLPARVDGRHRPLDAEGAKCGPRRDGEALRSEQDRRHPA